MKFEMTKCNQCGSPMLEGLDVCPSCGRPQSRMGKAGPPTPRMLLAIVLSAAVLFLFNWFKSSAPQTGQISSPPAASLSSR